MGVDFLRLFFLTGAPRSGTTVVSDWIMESPGAYCAHEIMPLIGAAASPSEILKVLRSCAETGADRLDKPGQRMFMNWQEIAVERQPRLLGWKEPMVDSTIGDPDSAHWSDLLTSRISCFLRHYDAPTVVLQRHPLDVLASAQQRAQATRNWPGYSTTQLCHFWLAARRFVQALERSRRQHLVLRWESLAIDPVLAAERLQAFLGHPISPSVGRERTPSYLHEMRATVCPRRGWISNPARGLLQPSATDEILKTLGTELAVAGYEL
jgi:hypothetical protein